MRRLGLALAATTIAVLFAAPSAPAAALAPDRVIVEWAAGASPAERHAARAEAGVDFTRDLGNRRFQLVETEPGQAPREAVRDLRADPAVILAERDGYARLDAVPDDPLFDQLWGLQKIDVLGAWERTLGVPSTVVAVLDSGYRFEHPDLADVVWTNPGETLDGADNDSNGIVDDLHGADFVGADAAAPVVDGDPTDDDLISGGHGVHTAGTIGAAGDNGIGIAGVARGVSLMPLRVCSRIDGENDCPHSAAIAAINYAGARGARVANMSFGSTTDSAAIDSAIAANPGTLFVASAGNEAHSNDVTPRPPCTVDPPGEGKGAVDNVICVAATDQADKLASFSNWGAKTVDLGAPGTRTLSTYSRHYFVDDGFELDDFAAKWDASGADGGFARTHEAPLSTYGIGDSPGAFPAAGSIRAATTVPVTMPPGIHNCVLEYDYLLTLAPGGRYWYEIRLDETAEVSVEVDSAGQHHGHHAVALSEALSAGGELDLRFGYAAGPNPGSGDGVWLDNIQLYCPAGLGEADGYAFLQGTSMAAPHVTGAAALLFSLRPAASVTAVRQALLGSVDRVPSLAGKTVTGGRLDASAALDLFDAVPPPQPLLAATNPAAPSNHNQPKLIGTAQPGTSVSVYANATCDGAPVASGSSAELASPGIAVSVGDNTTTQFTVRVTDLAPLPSACSAPISYTEKSPPPPPPPDPQPPSDPGPPPGPAAGGGGSTPAPGPVVGGGPTPACVVPKLAGKTLAQAKAALSAAACRPGAVRRPRHRRGGSLPPLVVKSSSPAAGAKPADGRVKLTLGPKPREAARR